MYDPDYGTRLVLKAQEALTADQQKTFLENFCAVNPRYKGAHVADVLDELNNTDAHIDVVEEIADHDTELDGRIVATATRVCIWLYGNQNVTWARVHSLASRISTLMEAA